MDHKPQTFAEIPGWTQEPFGPGYKVSARLNGVRVQGWMPRDADVANVWANLQQQAKDEAPRGS